MGFNHVINTILALKLLVNVLCFSMIKWFIGCSGFHYKHWKGVFYPEDLPQIKWFDFYCEHYHTLKLNVTFYRFPQ